MPESTGGGTKWFSSQFDRRRTKASSIPIEDSSDEGTPVLPEADGYESLDEAKTIDLSLEYATRAPRPEPVGMYTLPGGPLGARVAYGPRTLRILQMIRDTGGRLEPWQERVLDRFLDSHSDIRLFSLQELATQYDQQGLSDFGAEWDGTSPLARLDPDGDVARVIKTLNDYDKHQTERDRHYQEHLEDERILEEREAHPPVWVTFTPNPDTTVRMERVSIQPTYEEQMGDVVSHEQEQVAAAAAVPTPVVDPKFYDGLTEDAALALSQRLADSGFPPIKVLPQEGLSVSHVMNVVTGTTEECQYPAGEPHWHVDQWWETAIKPGVQYSMFEHTRSAADNLVSADQVKFVAPVDSFLTEADVPDEPGVVEPLVISRPPINRIEAISLDPEEIRVLAQIQPQQTLRFASRNWAFVWGEDIPIAQRLAGRGLVDVNMETTASSPLTVSLNDDGRDWLDLYRWRQGATTPEQANLEAIVVRALADPADRSGAGLSWGRERTPSPRARDIARRIVRDLEPYFAPNLSAKDAEQPY